MPSRIIKFPLAYCLALPLLLLLLCACEPRPFVDTFASGQVDSLLSIGSTDTVGQTFLAQHAGLEGIAVYIGGASASAAKPVVLHLRRAGPGNAEDLRTSNQTVPAATPPGWYRFEFAPIHDSHSQSYYFFIEQKGGADLQVGQLDAAAYPDGALYRNDQPLEAQLAFQLNYNATDIIVDLVRWIGQSVLVLLTGGLAFIVPGLAMATILLPTAKHSLSLGERVAIGGGLSLAAYPVLMLWTDVVGLHLGPLYAWLPVILGAAWLCWHGGISHLRGLAGDPENAVKRPGFRSVWLSALRQGAGSEAFWPELALIIVSGLILGVRLFAVRSLEVPMWGDSYQHTVLAQLLVDHGGLFNSWQPYTDLQTLTYHFGFHADAAVYHWLSGADLPQAVLLTGQLINAIAVIVLYPLTVRVSGNRWAGVAAVLLAGLLSPMPDFYTNWGRYTQLAGQAILPVAVLLAWKAFDSRASSWRLMALAAIAIGGVSLTHLRVLVFVALFVVAYLLIEIRRDERARTRIVNISIVTAVSALIFLPWFARLLGGSILSFATSQMTISVDATPPWIQQYNSISDLTIYLPALVWVLIPLSVGLGIWRKQRGMLLIALWWLLVAVTTNPQWVHLGGEGLITNFAVLIAAYIPAGVLVGSAAGWVTRVRPVADQGWQYCALAGLALGVGAWGARDRLSDINPPQYALVTEPDVRAAAWIQENTPRDARFLVNTFFAYGDTVIVGSDGGWWLPLLAHRQTTLPPLTYAYEKWPRADYGTWITQLPAAIQAKGITNPDVLEMLSERGITHIYIGQLHGRLNYSGSDVLQPEALLADAHYHAIYHQDLVWVFQVRQ